MIARHLPDPTDTGVTPAEEYFPLYFEDGHWAPPEKPNALRELYGPYAHEFDAARAVIAALRRAWVLIARVVRTVRALCEHPNFEFDHDGISSDIVREAVVELSRLADVFDANVAKLIEPPTPGDPVCIGPRFYRQNAETGRIELVADDRAPWPRWQRRLAAIVIPAVHAALGDPHAAPVPDPDEPAAHDDAFAAFVDEWFARQKAPAEAGSFIAFVAAWLLAQRDDSGVVAEPVEDPTTLRMNADDPPEATEADSDPADAADDGNPAARPEADSDPADAADDGNPAAR